MKHCILHKIDIWKWVNLYLICKEASFSFQLINCELFNEQILSTAPKVLLLLFANKLRTRVLWFPSNKGNLRRPWMVNRNFTFRAGIKKQKRCHFLAESQITTTLPPSTSQTATQIEVFTSASRPLSYVCWSIVKEMVGNRESFHTLPSSAASRLLFLFHQGLVFIASQPSLN